jgi:3',5'-cyclic AMP phosphodiesterase CpdA
MVHSGAGGYTWTEHAPSQTLLPMVMPPYPDIRYFAVKTDQHIVEPGTLLSGQDSNAPAAILAQALRKEAVPLEAVIDLGDLADTSTEPKRGLAVATVESYKHAAAILADLPGHRLHLPGNHDDPQLLEALIGGGWTESENGVSRWALGPITFVGIDLRTGPEPTGTLGSQTAAALARVLSEETLVILFSHYPLFLSDSRRVNDGLALTNRDSLVSILAPHRRKILAAFHGHLHLWWSIVEMGIPSYCSPGSGMALRLEPQSSERETVIPQPMGYYLVGVRDDGSIIVRPRFIGTV